MITSAVRYTILDRHKYRDFAVSSLDDFALGNSEAFDSVRLISDPCISLYALDFERDSACFVELPAAVALETKPFFYLSQFREATHLIEISLDEFQALAAPVEVDDSRLIFIQSVGRCGSTLISRAFESIGSVRSFSEPDPFTNLVGWRGATLAPDSLIKGLADCCIRVCCKPLVGSEAPGFVAIKFRSQCIEIDDLLADAFPAAKHIYLTRDPISWLDSSYRAFMDPQKIDDKDLQKWVEDMSASLHPLIRDKVVEGKPLPVWESMLLNWIANSQTFRKLQKQGISYFVADFSEIRKSGLETINRMLDYCGVPITEPDLIEECLSRDSQKGSGIDQTLINDPAKVLPEEMRTKALKMLALYGYSCDE